MTTKTSTVKTSVRLLAALAIALPTILVIIGIRSSIDVSSGLSKQKGRLEYYVSAATGASLVLLRSGNDAWGFFEWPEKRFYGFFSGKAQRGRRDEIKAAIRSASEQPLAIVIPARNVLGKMTIHLEGGKKTEGSFSFEESKLHDFNIESFAGRIDAGGRAVSPFRSLLKPISIEDGGADFANSFFHIYALGGKATAVSELFDNKLRRGTHILDYARDHWERFGEDRRAAAVTGTGNPSRVFVERQFLIPSLPDLYSIATERYVYSGGAHGNTTMVFETVDVVDGKTLGPSDIFVDGWEKPMAGKIRAEALSAFSDLPGEAPTTLLSHGFFDEAIHPSSSLFLCKTGIGFHYDRYELAPYSAGDFTFIVPWNELGGLLKIPAMREMAEGK
ncbi:MAG: DUF3298 domain-containing protein [Spirochaetales bacterium]|jgi:hypothetical protein